MAKIGERRRRGTEPYEDEDPLTVPEPVAEPAPAEPVPV